jgi:hypothetical protein
MLADLLYRFRALFRRNKVEGELDEELRFHFDEQVEKYVRSGLSRAEAVRQARIEFGGVEGVKEECRKASGVSVIETTLQDVRYAIRTLRKSPAFSVIAVVTLAIGIGANTAIFSVIEAVMLRPLPYKDPGRLAIFVDAVTYSDFDVWKSQSRTFADMAIYYRPGGFAAVTLTGAEPQAVRGGFVSANFFPLMGISPIGGRWFTREEEIQRERVVVISYGLWVRRFGGSPDVVGKTLEMDHLETRVIGVMPATFQFPNRQVQFWAPMTINRYWGESIPYDPANARGYWARWHVVGRLNRGVTMERAQAEMNAISAGLQRETPDPNRLGSIQVLPLRVELSGNTRLALYVLFSAVCCVLLIACSNVANLVLARGAFRKREMAVRTALGAGRGRLIRQLLTESAVLALFSGCFGVALAALGIRTLIASAPPEIYRLDQAGLNFEVLGFALAVTFVAAIFFGLTPAWTISRSDPNETLKSGTRAATGGVRLMQMRGLRSAGVCSVNGPADRGRIASAELSRRRGCRSGIPARACADHEHLSTRRDFGDERAGIERPDAGARSSNSRRAGCWRHQWLVRATARRFRRPCCRGASAGVQDDLGSAHVGQDSG